MVDVDDKRLFAIYQEFKTEGELPHEFMDRVISEGLKYFEELKEWGDHMDETEGRP